MYMHHVERRGDSYVVVREDGFRRASRKRLRHANEVCDALIMGDPRVTEADQIIRDLKPLVLREMTGDGGRPWAVVDRLGVVVRRFKYKFKARWWLNEYNSKRDIEIARGRAPAYDDAEDAAALSEGSTGDTEVPER